MAESRLDIVGEFGDLFPNLEKLAKTQDDLKTKVAEGNASMKAGYEQTSAAVQGTTAVLRQQVTQVNANVAGVDALKKKMNDLTAAVNANKNDAGLVTVLRKELANTQTEFVKAGGDVKKFGDGIKTGTEKSTEAFKGLRTQIIQAKAELEGAFQEYGKGSIQVDQAASKVAVLLDRQKQYNLLISALDPEQKFNVFAQAVRGGTAAVQTVVGAMALFGEKNEKVQETLVRLQALMTFTQGINQLLEFGKTWNSIRAVLGLTTAAKIKDTVVTEVNTGAQVENAVVVTAVSTGMKLQAIWTGIATVATTAFNVAIKALLGPIGWIIGGIGLLVGLFAAFSNSAEKFSDTIDGMKQNAEDFATATERLTEKNKSIVQNANNDLEEFKSAGEARIAQMKKNNATEAQLAEEKKKLAKDVMDRELAIQREIGDQAEQELQRNRRRLQQIAKDINQLLFDTSSGNLSKEEVTASKEQSAALLKESNELVKANAAIIDKQSDADSKLIQLKNEFNKDSATIDDEATKRQKEKDKTAKEERLRAEKEYNDAVKALRDKVLQSESAHSTGQIKLEADRKIALNEISDLEKNLIAKGKLTDKHFKLSVDQQKQFETLRLGVEKDFADKSLGLEIQRQLELSKITKFGLDKEIADFRTNFIKRVEELKKLGLSETQITAIRSSEELKIRKDYLLKQLDQEDAASKAMVDQLKINGVSEANAERIRNEKKLEVDLEFAKKKLFLLETERTLTPNPELENEIKIAKGEIEKFGREVKAAKKEIIDNAEPFSLGKLLGFTGDEATKLNQAASQFLTSLSDIGKQLLKSSMDEVDAQIANNQKIVDNYTNRINDIDALITKDEERQKKGFANNLDLDKRQQLALKASRDKTLAEQKRLQDEKRKLQQEEAEINAAATASALIVSTVNVIESLSKLPLGVGVVLGLAAAAALVAGFAGIKNSIKSTETQTLEYGGLVGGKSHGEGGGNKYVSQDGNKILYTERGEFYVNRKSTARHLNLLNAINSGNEDSINLHDVYPFLRKHKIALSTDVSKPIMERIADNNTFDINHAATVRNEFKEEMKDMKLKLHKEVSEINKHLKSQPQYHTDADGNLVQEIARGNVIERTTYVK